MLFRSRRWTAGGGRPSTDRLTAVWPVRRLSQFGFTGDALYWASVLKSVRNIAPETKQATAFGIMEFISGGWEFITNALAVAVYTWLGYTIFGMKVAMGINAGLTILSALTIWFFVPEENLLQTNVSREKTRLAFKGFLQVLRMPAVWMTGLAASCVYATFAAVNTYFVPYLKNVYLLPIAWVSIFGLINGSFTRLTAGPIAGFSREIGRASCRERV